MSLSATLKIKSHRDCLLHVPGEHKWRKLLSNATSNKGIVVLKLTWSNSQHTSRIFVSSSPTLLLNTKNPDEVQLDPLFAAANNIQDNEQVCVEAIRNVAPCKAVTVAPDDWAVCNLDQKYIQEHLRDQIIVVHPNLQFPLYKGQSLLCRYVTVIGMEPSNVECALLGIDTLVVIPSSPPASYNRSSGITYLSADSNSSRGIYTRNSGSKTSSDSGYSSGSGGGVNSGHSGGADSGYNGGSTSGSSGSYTSGHNNSSTSGHNSSSTSGFTSGHSSSSTSGHNSSSTSGSSGSSTSGHSSEATSPISATSTPSSISPTPWDPWNLMTWLLPQPARTPVDLRGTTVDPLPNKRNVTTTTGVPSAPVKGNHKKQASWPAVGKLLPENIDTPPLNVILRVQPHSNDITSSLNDVEQLDVFVHPSTLPVLYMRKHFGHEGEESIAGYLVKLQTVLPPEKPAKKQPKSEQDDESAPASQSRPTDDKGMVKALVVRLCFSYHLSSTQEPSANVKPGHILISDCVRQQMSIRDFSHVRLTEVTNSMRIPCNGHSIKLTPLNSKNGMTEKELRDTFQKWVHKVGMHSPYSVPLTYHMVLALQTKSGKLCNVEVKLTGGSAKKKQDKEQVLNEDVDKEIDFILLEDRDFTGNRVSLSVDMNPPVKSTSSSSSAKSSSVANSGENEDTILSPRLREPLVAEPRRQLGGIDRYVKEGLNWVTNALEKQLDVHGMGHGLNAGALLICGRSKSGNSGCGITSIAKEICRKAIDYPLLAHVIIVECAEHRGRAPHFKDVLLEKLSEARWFQPSIVLLDDVDHIAPSVHYGQHEHGSEAFQANRMAELIRDALIEETSRGSSIVVMATAQSIDAVHSKLLPSRGNHLFRKTIEISTPSIVVREEILKAIIKNKGIDVAENLDWRKVSGGMEGFVVKDLINIVERALHHSEQQRTSHNTLVTQRFDRSPSVDTIAPLQPNELHYKDFEKALEMYKPVPLRNITLHKPEDISFDDIGGLKLIKTMLIETILWPAKFPKVYSSFTLKRTSGVLLYGAPGTGKTMLAKAIGRQFGLNFISIKGPELLSKYIGASEQAVRDVFVRAHSAKPCILFFDEFDALAPQRGHDNTGVTDRVVNQLLTQMDGLETLEGVYILAASSRPDLIDPALLRPGRIDKYLHCELPDIDERVEILKALSRPLTCSNDIDFNEIARQCEYFTGADLKALLYNAQLFVAHRCINSIDSAEKINKGGALNGMTPHSDKMWFSSNVGDSEVKKGEISQKLKVIQRNTRRDKKIKKNKQVEKLNITQKDFMIATRDMQPSLSEKDRIHFLRLYNNFVNKSSTTEYINQSCNKSFTTEYMQQKATLA